MSTVAKAGAAWNPGAQEQAGGLTPTEVEKEDDHNQAHWIDVLFQRNGLRSNSARVSK